VADLLPNAPLVLAIFQLRFAGETAVEAGRVAFQEATRDRLPKLYVPKTIVGQAPSLQGVVFRSEDESESVELAVNAFTYYSSRYDGFSSFKERVQSYLEVFNRSVKIHRLTRAGLRYVNHIPILRASPTAAIPLDDYLNVGLRLPATLGADLTEVNTAFTIRMAEGTLRILVKHERIAEPRDGEILVLDFDFAQEDNLNQAQVEEYLDRAHAHTKRVFSDLISAKYWPIMRGETQ
jgi:uncharacterized protein (TIGR04255 family)